MEICQYTYFQQIGGIECNPVSVEITYGLERLAMFIQKVNSVFDIIWNVNKKEKKQLLKSYQVNKKIMNLAVYSKN